MDRDDGPHAGGTGASHERPPQVPLEGGQRGQGHSIAGGPGLTLPQATEEEQTAIRAMLNKRAASAPAGVRDTGGELRKPDGGWPVPNLAADVPALRNAEGRRQKAE